MEKEDHYHGILVAFEGPDDAVSTQMRLLPTSPQVLILPSIQAYMQGEEESRYSARALVKNAHKAAEARHDVAMAFLRGSSANNKRIVFLSGGTAGAVSQCIAIISEHQAPGDLLAAESVFRNVAQYGVKGLDRGEKYSDPTTLQMLGREADSDVQYWENDEVEDPITKAMRAADALYEETEFLQPVVCFTRKRPRSLSLPMYGYADEMGEPSPFYVFGSQADEEDRLDSNLDRGEPTNCQQTMEEELAKIHAMRNQNGIPRGRLVLTRPPSRLEEPYEPHNAETQPTMQALSPILDAVLSPPATPDGVIYGEARLVQMRASRMNKPLRNTRSLEDLELHQARRRRISSTSTAPAPKRAALSGVSEAKSRHLSIVEDPYSSNNLLHLPQAKFVKAHTTTIRKSPTFQGRPPKPTRESYVHRGTDAADFDDEHRALAELFQPVLPLTEDLVIRFTDGTYNPILDSVIQSFKSGSLPVCPSPHASSHIGPTNSCPSTAMASDLSSLKEQVWLPRVAEHPDYSVDSEEYNPFMARGHDVRCSQSKLQTPSPPLSAVAMYTRQLPTPSQTPPPVANKTESRFHEFSTSGRPNAIVVQNELRSVLELYFPPQQDEGYHELSRRPLPDMGSLWSPIFSESAAHGNKMSGRSTDLILAIGCQRGVKRDFLPALMGQIEKLGAKPSGMSRSGRLDIRYLIANAMQSFTAQPLLQQTHNNPFENPYLLSCLIIPHLETYLAVHSSIRFLLLEYPAEHLATVLALQKLVGNNILKVAGIIDSEATSPISDNFSPPSSKHSSRTCAVYNNIDINSLDSINLGGPPFPDNKPSLGHRRRHSFSKANYLLTSSASESDIAVFISTIWKLLIEVDSFYVPERSPSHGSRAGTARSMKGTITGAVPLPKLMSKLTIQGRNDNSPVYTHTPPMSPRYDVNDGGEGNSNNIPRHEVSGARRYGAEPGPETALEVDYPPPAGESNRG
ncbi:hypothetical protein VMCG_07391 [Cytospora schulzeri]|uniref:Uncharacterized protein n=1 Tax=Cytospora schulzeri TaxID=448051 RepID=A0A423W326_9PEZI|nr:hypothetical protein VMCG_07391 [Valsa malicola]